MINKFLEEEKWNYYPLVIPIGIFFIVFLLWASFTKIDEVVRGEGKVMPSGQTKVLQHLEGGIISEILVKQGDHVTKGQVLYRLNNEYFDADLKSKEIELMAYEAKAFRLVALINEEETLQYSDEFRTTLPKIIINEMFIFREEKIKYQNKIDIAKDQLRQKELKLDELQSKFENLSTLILSRRRLTFAPFINYPRLIHLFFFFHHRSFHSSRVIHQTSVGGGGNPGHFHPRSVHPRPSHRPDFQIQQKRQKQRVDAVLQRRDAIVEHDQREPKRKVRPTSTYTRARPISVCA